MCGISQSHLFGFISEGKLNKFLPNNLNLGIKYGKAESLGSGDIKTEIPW